MEIIELKIPSNAKYFSSIRLFLSGLLTNLDFDIEKIEDFKIALSECLNIALKLKCQDEIDVKFCIDEDKFEIEIGKICKKDIDEDDELSLSLTIIDCLVDKSSLEDEKLSIIVGL